MNKIVNSVKESVADIPDGAVIVIGGFGGAGLPTNLMNALIEQGAKGLTIVGNGTPQWKPFLEAGHLRRIIAGFTHDSRSHDLDQKMDAMIEAGELEIETVPHGILEERIRAGGIGFPAFYSPTGIGTLIEEGKEKRVFDGQEFVLEQAIKGHYQLIKGRKADRWGNIVCRLGAGNRNITMAMGSGVTIAEVDDIVELGELDPNRIDIPGIFVDRVVQVPRVFTWLQNKEKI